MRGRVKERGRDGEVARRRGVEVDRRGGCE